MMKRFYYAAFAALLAFALLFSVGCETDADDDTYPTSVVNAVYGGLNPMGAWTTVTFRSDKMVAAFSGDNTSNAYDYVYDASTGNGSIGGTGWNPGDWELNSSGSTLTFTNFGGHGNALEFNRLRKTDLSLEAGPSSGLATLATDDLAGSTWGGSTPASGGAAFATFTFKTGNSVVASFSHDNSTNAWTYIYNTAGNTGTITTATWLGAFNISEDGKEINFPNLMGGGNNARSFNRYK